MHIEAKAEDPAVTSRTDPILPQRTIAVAAWMLVALTVLLMVGGMLLARAPDGSTPADVLDVGGFAMFSLVGAFVLTHRQGNLIGWIMLGAGLAFVLDAASIAYVEASVAGWDVPAPVVAAWLAAWVWSPGWTLAFGWLPLLFPDGRLLSRRWRWLAAGLMLGSLQVIPAMVLPTLRYGDDEQIFGPNPIGLEGHGPLLEALVEGVAVVLIPFWLAIIVHQVLRYRRSDPTARLQLRWFLWSIIVVIGLFLASMIPGVEPVLQRLPFSLPIALIPISVGVAITRYRLYDIDRIISRAVTFTIVIALLAALYVSGVLAVGALLRPIAPDSDLAVAVATLLAAAAFRPVLARVRSRVDRRFDRGRYDAVAEVEAFGQRLRDELDLHQIRTDLAGASRRTMQPAAAWVWLPPGP